MIFRARTYPSGTAVKNDLRKLGFDYPEVFSSELMAALFVEGNGPEVRSFCDMMREKGSRCLCRRTGLQYRACVLAGDLRSLDTLVGEDEDAISALQAYCSQGAPSMTLPRDSLDFSRPLVMGIVNATPDSFSEGRGEVDVAECVQRALRMVAEGADIIDVGGESTRPGALPVDTREELGRVVPIISFLSERTTLPISVDTRKPEVAMAAIEAGASIINDVSGLEDPAMVDVASQGKVSVILMHMLGDPMTMQEKVDATTYEDVVADIMRFWEERMDLAEDRGLSRDRIILDPGIGFGKLLEHNLEILDRLREMRCSGRPLLIGASRKGFIGRITGEPPEQRLGGSLAAAALAALNGANIIRVHDVRETVGLLRTLNAITNRSKT
jgi:dihydropteroate synthase